MTKVVYNACYGGFSLSDEAIEMYLNLKGLKYNKIQERWGSRYVLDGFKDFYDRRDIERHDPVLVEVLEKLGDRANGECAKLKIEDVASGLLYRITSHDGYESVDIKYDSDWRMT